MIPLTFGIEEDLRLSISARDPLSVSRVDLQPGKRANFDFQHFDDLKGFSLYEFKPQKPEFALHQKIKSKGVIHYHNLHFPKY